VGSGVRFTTIGQYGNYSELLVPGTTPHANIGKVVEMRVIATTNATTVSACHIRWRVEKNG